MKIFLWETNGSFQEQGELAKICEEIIRYPFSGLFLEEQFFPEVEKLLPITPSLSFLGSGDYHFLSFFFQERVPLPFRLLLIDFHPDFKESEEGFLSCGNWLNQILKLDNCREVWIVGPGETGIFHPKVKVQSPLRANWEQLHSLPLYISLDKDVLSSSELKLGWDQGTWNERELINLLSSILSEGVDLVGADVCGEPVWNPSDFSLNSQLQVKKSEKINLKIASLFEGVKPFFRPR